MMAWSIHDEEVKLPLFKSPSESHVSFNLSPMEPEARQFGDITPEQIINELYDTNPFDEDRVNEFKQAGWTPDPPKLLLSTGYELLEKIETQVEIFLELPQMPIPQDIETWNFEIEPLLDCSGN